MHIVGIAALTLLMLGALAWLYHRLFHREAQRHRSRVESLRKYPEYRRERL